jgi:hypothetical protein
MVAEYNKHTKLISKDKNKTAIVVTSINKPGEALRQLSLGSQQENCDLIVIGDAKSPKNFTLDGCRFFDLDAQIKTGFKFAELCPANHYARKNVGYLIAIRDGALPILETDDDNIPGTEFFHHRTKRVLSPVIEANGCVNVYRYFTDSLIWPRGFPLDEINKPVIPFDRMPVRDLYCPIQQGLADGNPDVDAIYRLLFPALLQFSKDRHLALGKGSWCPFNSQNTLWWPDAYPLLYLPSYCSFRMTDIYRSFVAQRIACTNDWYILFHKATVWQKRNEHNLMNDFKDEVPGYLKNRDIYESLQTLKLQPGTDSIFKNMRLCYERFVEMELVEEKELALLEIWQSEIKVLIR